MTRVSGGFVYWVDRSLGRTIVPSALREAGVDIRLYDDLYDDPRVPDVEWIPEVAARGWVILTKDKYIRRSPVELLALQRAGARYVCLSAGRMRGEEQGFCLVQQWKTIDSVVRSKPVPLIITVTRTAVQWLDDGAWRTAKAKR